jgi:hypothetical protein
MPQFEKIEPQMPWPTEARYSRVSKGLLRCSQCGEYKPFEAFYRSKVQQYGRGTQCKSCNYQSVLSWRSRNPNRMTRLRGRTQERELVARHAAYAATATWLQSATDDDAVLRSLLASHLPVDYSPGQMAVAMRAFRQEIKRFERKAAGRTVDDECVPDPTREERKQ